MFDTVIVGIDGSAGGRDALALARELASAPAEITLAYVYATNFLPFRGSSNTPEAAPRQEALETLETARKEAGTGVTVSPVACNKVGRGLHELAEAKGADLLVVGSSRRGRFGRVLLGDDMREALNGAPCAVGVAPAGYAERPRVLGEIGVGYDGSAESEAALAAAQELAARHHARLSAFQAVELQSADVDDARHPDQETLDRVVKEASDRVAALGDVEAHAAYGDPAEELTLYGASVDLLVVGSRNYGPHSRLIHGSTSARLAATARCPLLVLPRRAAAATEESREREMQATT